ncbi:cytochrome c [Fulvimarina endophytica]|uniref:Cytochrome c n=1 Tax=Fulvimarina endophytica TaxID=2293836 RepID=A0A371X8Y6_9HYPH|nr:cytochrome c [Fulvimarina endophytica]RFC65524.1 cytochrome c [Fulvimarina endophytica]
MRKRHVFAVLAIALGPVSAVPASAADAEAGRGKAGACAACHGRDGIAVAPDAPNLAGMSPIYTVAQLKAFKSGARQHEQMSIIAQSLSEEDMADLAAWYAAIEVTAKLPGS